MKKMIELSDSPRGSSGALNLLENALELKISKFLRGGVIVSGIIMLIGWLPELGHGDPFESLKEYHPRPLVDQLVQDWDQQGWGLLICYLGLGILISLPLIRVLLTAVLFMKHDEKLLAGIAAFVFVALIVSFSFGIKL
jgi:uncharacterized membrane protein